MQFILCSALIQRLQLFTWLESNGFAGLDADFCSCTWVTTDAGLSGFYGEDAESTKLDAVTRSEALLHRVKDGVDCGLCLGAWQTSSLDHPLDKILLDQF